jgi:hypothetical protein
MAVRGLCCTQQLLKFGISKVSIMHERLRLTGSAQSVRREQPILDSPIDKTFDGAEYDRPRRWVERVIELMHELRNVGETHREPCPRKHINQLLAPVPVGLACALRRIVQRVLEERLAHAGDRNGTVNLGEQSLLFDKLFQTLPGEFFVGLTLNTWRPPPISVHHAPRCSFHQTVAGRDVRSIPRCDS